MRLPIILTLTAVLSVPAAAQAPRRVVSLDLCADQLLVVLADRGQIAGLSPQAVDPALSTVAEQAEALPRIGTLQEAAAAAPDLVLAGLRNPAGPPGSNVVTLEAVTDIEDAKRQAREIAALLGHPQRGDALAARIDAARGRLAAAHPQGATAILVERGRAVTGPASLAVSLMAAAGLTSPPGAPAAFGGFVPMERLVTLRPDYLIFSNGIADPNGFASSSITHPAMRLLYPRWKRIVLPGRYTLCGGPALVEALDYFAGVMTRLAARK